LPWSAWWEIAFFHDVREIPMMLCHMLKQSFEFFCFFRLDLIDADLHERWSNFAHSMLRMMK
jgi:hypothetical protein